MLPIQGLSTKSYNLFFFHSLFISWLPIPLSLFFLTLCTFSWSFQNFIYQSSKMEEFRTFVSTQSLYRQRFFLNNWYSLALNISYPKNKQKTTQATVIKNFHSIRSNQIFSLIQQSTSLCFRTIPITAVPGQA